MPKEELLFGRIHLSLAAVDGFETQERDAVRDGSSGHAAAATAGCDACSANAARDGKQGIQHISSPPQP